MTNTSLLSVFGNYIQPPTAALIIITSIVSVVSIHCRAFSYFLLVILFLVIFFLIIQPMYCLSDSPDYLVDMALK